ncbi:hypothetical protein LOK74_20445 [Brevibacillus humidisoli]|uniref:hypothetical protein n=1 Tax=Brevibacillus humidisoli TaxID=2895522 RepID=UPI001E4968A5|nr:hypothetical protein [Brevibacillus humidisoli]UFJ40373.1 hypothetical protein LOK74_20445 [Brevibacillus humidisoli]
MSVQWFSPNKTIPAITIASYGISFNAGCLPYFKDVESVMLGCDTTTKKVHVKLLKNEEGSGFSVPKIDEKTKNVRISCREFVQFIQLKFKYDVSKTYKFFVDEVLENELIIDLSSPVVLEKKAKSQK